MAGTDEILIVATEASGDLHAARVLEELRLLRPGLRAFGMGGPRLRAAGFDALRDAEEMSVMGVAEVLPRIPAILRILGELAAAAAARRPGVALLVDSPDFNLPLAKRLKRAGVPVVYYVSPSVWAWRRGRVKTIARVVDRMLCILPFEERFYAGTGVSARFVGHPLLERPPPGPAAGYRAALGLAPSRTTVALVPGSRRSELERIFPPMLEAAERIRAAHPDVQFVVPVAATLSEAALRPFLARHAALDVKLAPGRVDEAVGAADAALVKSGTSVLEAALMLRPMVVVYRLSWLSYLVGRLFVRLAHFALVNLLAGRTLVPELLQRQASPERMAAEVLTLLDDGAARAEQLRGLAEVRASLGEPGAPRRVAEELLTHLETT
ncbi:lipid-A-disaccharide synthase [Anaeromyxobacter diazotrophicus]|uniref:Lipid-A-disaccharide synthase n=1 Tax=Anaeromyxobacter diazotrophicus TaxID=2590199 RepID=A0A7I9VIS8_9BACT|nr:lipid-A-disaccharide synthase [Anaeromyxobacter diazotrophicus]GEJ56311.1 lipid-A-disaccharide synthase [Anaeromyxobacter diazotrophicus]